MEQKKIVARRTELTTPGHTLKLPGKAAASQADEVMIDLEDACAVSQKEAARSVVVEALNTLDWRGKIRAFRPNNVHTRFFLDDMYEVIKGAGQNLDVVILPKTEQVDEVIFVDRLLTALERKFDLPVGRIQLEVLIESARGVLHAEEIAHCSPRMAALIFGIADYSGDIGARLTEDAFSDFIYAKQKTVAAAKSAGIDAIDNVTLKFKDLELTRKDAERAARMGFDGKWAIHPAQVEVINAAFTPSEEEVKKALEIVEAYKRADIEQGLGAIVIGDEMVDAATVRVERKKLAVAVKAGILKESEIPS